MEMQSLGETIIQSRTFQLKRLNFGLVSRKNRVELKLKTIFLVDSQNVI